MKNRILIAALALVLSGPAFAADLGIGVGGAAAQSNSIGGAQSTGGSFAALAGATLQGSTASANSGGGALAGFSNNNAFSTSAHTYNSSQSGGAAALGLAGSGNANTATGTGGSQGTAQGAFIWIFTGP